MKNYSGFILVLSGRHANCGEAVTRRADRRSDSADGECHSTVAPVALTTGPHFRPFGLDERDEIARREKGCVRAPLSEALLHVRMIEGLLQIDADRATMGLGMPAGPDMPARGPFS